MSKNTWITSEQIYTEHDSHPIRQIYVWFITSDQKIAIVGKNGKFQFPGGKPEKDESRMETIERELFEEAGIILNNDEEKPQFFGYYLVENDPNWDTVTYLQIRYLLRVNSLSNEIPLSVNERKGDIDQLEEARFVDLDTLPKHIPWTQDLEEYKVALQIASDDK